MHFESDEVTLLPSSIWYQCVVPVELFVCQKGVISIIKNIKKHIWNDKLKLGTEFRLDTIIMVSELWREMTKWNSFTNTRRESNITGGLQSLHIGSINWFLKTCAKNQNMAWIQSFLNYFSSFSIIGFTLQQKTRLLHRIFSNATFFFIV